MDLQRAKELLSGLADGVDPLTGEVLPEDHVCNKAEIIRAFHCVLKALPGKPPKPQPENAGKPWNDADDAVLCQMFDAGGSRKEMCAYFKRSEGSIWLTMQHALQKRSAQIPVNAVSLPPMVWNA